MSSYSLVLVVVENDELEEVADPCIGTLGEDFVLDSEMTKEGASDLYGKVIEALIEKGFVI